MLTENGMIDERYEVAAELMTLRAEIERLERLANTWAEVIMKRDTEIERLARDNERLLLKANSLSDDLRETEAELAEAKSGLSAARDLKLDEIDRLQRELAEAREWIEETGHRISCPWRHTKLTRTDLWPPCACGFIAMVAAKEGER
jgi:chromosome segregation ATPase